MAKELLRYQVNVRIEIYPDKYGVAKRKVEQILRDLANGDTTDSFYWTFFACIMDTDNAESKLEQLDYGQEYYLTVKSKKKILEYRQIEGLSSIPI